MYKILNILGGELVCTLASGTTLRLEDRKSVTIKDSEMNDYLRTIESKGFIKITSTSTNKNNKKEE